MASTPWTASCWTGRNIRGQPQLYTCPGQGLLRLGSVHDEMGRPGKFFSSTSWLGQGLCAAHGILRGLQGCTAHPHILSICLSSLLTRRPGCVDGLYTSGWTERGGERPTTASHKPWAALAACTGSVQQGLGAPG